MASRPRVALFVETSRAYGRGIVRGIWQYIQEHDHWSILFRPHGFGEPAPTWAASWDGEGIIAYVTNRKTARLLRQSAVPCLDLDADPFHA